METQGHKKVEWWKMNLRLIGALLFPPSRRRLWLLWRTSQRFFKLFLGLARDPEGVFWGTMEEAANTLEEELSSANNGDDLADLRQELIELPKILKPIFKEELVPLYYVYETEAWMRAVLDKEDSQRTYANILKRVKRVLEGRAKPLFVPFTIPNPDAELVEYLLSSDAVRAIERIEAISFERVILLIPADTALVHLVVTDDGTFGIITQKDTPPEIVLNKSFTRQRVENLLRGWMWLYYWHSEDMYDSV